MFNERKHTRRDVLRELAENIDSTLHGFNGFTTKTDPVYYSQPADNKITTPSAPKHKVK